MTTKELSYIEDALGHEKYFQTQYQETLNKIQDQQLKNCVKELGEKHQQIFRDMYGLL